MFKEVRPPENVEWRDEKSDPDKEYVLVRRGAEFMILNRSDYIKVKNKIIEVDSAITTIKYIPQHRVILVGT
ncbi:MAG: hypothetical protein QXL15_05075, partial [Candidatus Korarchaeota archaeon]